MTAYSDDAEVVAKALRAAALIITDLAAARAKKLPENTKILVKKLRQDALIGLDFSPGNELSGEAANLIENQAHSIADLEQSLADAVVNMKKEREDCARTAESFDFGAPDIGHCVAAVIRARGKEPPV